MAISTSTIGRSHMAVNGDGTLDYSATREAADLA
jgi:hypothetical protein